MPAFYVDQRQRTMLGAVRVVPRRRRLLGDFYEGATAAPVLPSGDFYAGATASPIVAPDLGTPTFQPTSTLVPVAPPAPPQFPAGFFSPSRPIVPAPSTQPVVAPTINKTFPSVPGVTLVFPSQGSVSRQLVPTSWFDQQMISGIPNSYLAGGVLGIVLLVMVRSGGKRRR